MLRESHVEKSTGSNGKLHALLRGNAARGRVDIGAPAGVLTIFLFALAHHHIRQPSDDDGKHRNDGNGDN